MGSMKDRYTQMEEQGYSHSEISVRMRSTDKEWNNYLEERDKEFDDMTIIAPAPNGVRKSKRISRLESYEPFEGEDGRMAYMDDAGRIHKEYIDEDDRDNDSDYWQ